MSQGASGTIVSQTSAVLSTTVVTLSAGPSASDGSLQAAAVRSPFQTSSVGVEEGSQESPAFQPGLLDQAPSDNQILRALSRNSSGGASQSTRETDAGSAAAAGRPPPVDIPVPTRRAFSGALAASAAEQNADRLGGRGFGPQGSESLPAQASVTSGEGRSGPALAHPLAAPSEGSKSEPGSRRTSAAVERLQDAAAAPVVVAPMPASDVVGREGLAIGGAGSSRSGEIEGGLEEGVGRDGEPREPVASGSPAAGTGSPASWTKGLGFKSAELHKTWTALKRDGAKVLHCSLLWLLLGVRVSFCLGMHCCSFMVFHPIRLKFCPNLDVWHYIVLVQIS